MTTIQLTEQEQKLLIEMTEVAKVISKRYNLNFVRIEPADFQLWGRCNPNGVIEIAFYKHLPPNERWTIDRASQYRTLGHELAHLVVGGHGPKFWEVCNLFIKEIGVLIGKKLKPEQNVYNR